MPRRGRKPLALGHVGRLDGSQRAKQRMTAFLSTLQGQCTVTEACQKLGLSESHFHAARQRWLQQSLALLEPRPAGRPPRRGEPSADTEQLRQRVDSLQRELALSELRREVADVLGGQPVKKGRRRKS